MYSNTKALSTPMLLVVNHNDWDTLEFGNPVVLNLSSTVPGASYGWFLKPLLTSHGISILFVPWVFQEKLNYPLYLLIDYKIH